jgi:L-ascorbate metabolism protein UlaG (beta-lactamase superfamily)
LIITHVGGPTVLIEFDGWRLLTDPTFDPAGGHYDFGWGTSSEKLAGPAVAASDLPPIDAVLLTRDHHGEWRAPAAAHECTRTRRWRHRAIECAGEAGP